MKVLYGSSSGFHAVDLDSASVYDIYLPKHAQVGEKINGYEIFGGSEIQFDNQILPKGPVTPHTIVTLPNTNGMQLLLCYDNEGVYVNTYGKVLRLYNNCRKLMNATCIQVSKNIVLQWGELPTSVAYIGTGQIMGWGNKAIEIRLEILWSQ